MFTSAVTRTGSSRPTSFHPEFRKSSYLPPVRLPQILLLAFARPMMKRHWAPTILDGHAYHGRPQKPCRLRLAKRLRARKWLTRAWLTHRSCGRFTSLCIHCSSFRRLCSQGLVSIECCV
ncbi:hypothetical protein BDU57DRAFT_524308 [Ampelomyces quisqualis]|uniref:Uncharacterized protein n=1 Tax=Ampelomyces quisqualis TaxID=50730 RepID=A0A6A5Q6R3_AMPQU|nr:hypothetical protein BDU57DRAFT_524308 [Ampelomyces quisqualis]